MTPTAWHLRVWDGTMLPRTLRYGDPAECARAYARAVGAGFLVSVQEVRARPAGLTVTVGRP
jgi:hypothetical protein